MGKVGKTETSIEQKVRDILQRMQDEKERKRALLELDKLGEQALDGLERAMHDVDLIVQAATGLCYLYMRTNSKQVLAVMKKMAEHNNPAVRLVMRGVMKETASLLQQGQEGKAVGEVE